MLFTYLPATHDTSPKTAMEPGRPNSVRKRRWKNVAVVAGLLLVVGLVWVFGPLTRTEDAVLPNYVPIVPDNGDWPLVAKLKETFWNQQQYLFGGSETYPSPLKDSLSETNTPSQPTQTDDPTAANHAINIDDDIIPLSVILPSSPETDPDPAKTIVCTTPFKPSLTLVQYAVIIDAGITGSRMHIYKLNNCLPTILYEYKVFRSTRASLHRYQDRPLEAAQSLDVLLDEVLDIVPAALHKWTPVIIKASYSHRLFLDSKKWAEILDAIRHRLDERYPFSLRDADIMSEKEQGIYSWIAANYLMDALHADSPPNTPTYAVLGLAGAITNIIFEPELDSTKPDNVLQESKDKYELNFGGRIRVLYQHTHVGFGLNSARTKIHHLVESMASVEGQMAHEGTIANPCLAKGTTQVVDTLWERKSKKINMVGDDVGSFEACNRIVELVLAKDPICEVRPCWFDDVDQPSLLDTFPNGKVVLYYFFYDRIRPLLAESSAKPPRAIKISALATLAEQLCQGKSSWDKWWGHDDALMVELERNPQWCLDLTFIYALLRHGYGLESDKEVEIGAELDWTLGVAIAMLQS